MLTCTEVCAQLGETCVEDGCACDTTVHGAADQCASQAGIADYSGQACDEVIPIVITDNGGDGDGDSGGGPAWIYCCCTLSS
jgi:hypothetical protein